jgi:hypothetical protein
VKEAGDNEMNTALDGLLSKRCCLCTTPNWLFGIAPTIGNPRAPADNQRLHNIYTGKLAFIGGLNTKKEQARHSRAILELCGDVAYQPLFGNIEPLTPDFFHTPPPMLHLSNALATDVQAFVDGSDGGFQFTKARRRQLSKMVRHALTRNQSR